MNPLVLLKLLDLAVIGFTAYERHQAAQTENSQVSAKLDTLRKQILLGEISDDRAAAEIDEIVGGIISRRHAAFDALPKPGHEGHS